VSDAGAPASPAPKRWSATPWFAAVAAAVALVLVVGGLVVVKRSRAEKPEVAVAELGTAAPSAFDVSLAPLTSPFVSRGEPVTVQVSVPAGMNVARIELWEDGERYYELDDVDLVTEPTTGAVRFSLDVVPVTAGAHILLARAYSQSGDLAQSLPFAMPVLDLVQDLGVKLVAASTEAALPAMQFAAAPGDSLQTIADRLRVNVGSLTAADGTTEPNKTLAAGVVVKGTVPAVSSLKPPKASPKLATDIAATVDGCTAVVTSATTADLRIYGGAGMVALGDLPTGGELRLTSLPIGPTVLAAYAPDGTSPVLPPSAPITVTIPDSCGRDAWKGSAYITGGMLLTDDSIAEPYAYISVDKGTWQRVPSSDGQYLNGATTTVSDLRSLIQLTAYDQIDLEVWSGASGELAASGQFCRKDGNHDEPAGSSASGGECSPPASAPSGAPGTAPTKPIILTLSAGAGRTQLINLDSDPAALQTWQVTGPGVAGFSTDAAKQGYGSVMYQFSLIPFSPGSTGLSQPGVFYQVAGDVYGTAQVDPWKWHGSLISEDQLTGVDDLSLDDELALGMLKQHIAQGANLIDTVYVRAVAVQQVPNTSTYVSRGASSNTIELSMPTGLEGTWPQINDASITVKPGRDVLNIVNGHAKPSKADNPVSVSAVTTTCHSVVTYPDPTEYISNPAGAPVWRTLDGITYQSGMKLHAADVKVQGPVGDSDLQWAKRLWPRADVIYCLDKDADYLRAHAHDNDEPPSCGIGCVLSFVVYGAAQGFVAGGPYGALVGALAGLAVGLGSAMDPAFYADVMAVWDKVASFYNQVFDVISQVVAAVNPACQSAKSLGAKASQFCNGVFRSVGESLLTYYTGVPPRLATSAELEAAQDGDMNAVIMLALDEGLKKLGLNCSTFTMSAGEVNAVFTVASQHGADVPDLSSVKDSSGDISGCAALAGLLTKTVRAALTERQAQIMEAITGIPSVPGLVIAPVSDERPTVVFTGTPTTAPGFAQNCPVVVNAEITEGATTFRFYPIHSTAWLKYGKTDTDGVRAADSWTGEISIPAERSTAYPTLASKDVMATVGAAPGTAYLHVTLTAPCFDEPITVDVPKYSFFGNPAAFYMDARPIVAYH
jgi:hypothetical protein